MNTCSTCEHLESKTGHPRYWLCMCFERDQRSPINGEQLPPYHYCSDVRRLGRTGPHDCPFWSEKRDESARAVVTEARGEKSVTFGEEAV